MAGKVSRRPARANRPPRHQVLENLHDAGVPKGKPKGGRLAKRMPMNMAEVRELLSSKGEHKYLRMPIGRRENRYWNMLWRFKGRPYNKTPYKGDSKDRKVRQENQSKSWTAKRKRNNEKKAA